MEVSRQQLFEPKEPLEIKAEDFDTIWHLIDNVWTQFGSSKIRKRTNDNVSTYICRLSKFRKNPLPKEFKQKAGEPRQTPSRRSNLCNAKIKIIKSKQGEVKIHLVGSTGHNHSLEESDRMKLSSSVKEILATECRKGYSAGEVSRIVENIVPTQEGQCQIGYMDIYNIRRSLPNVVAFEAKVDLNTDLKNIQECLQEKGYKTHLEPSLLVFANDFQLAQLASTLLALMDTTFKTNQHGWQLCTLYVKTSSGTWCAGASAIMQKENAENVSRFLLCIKKLSVKWRPLYFLIDDSHVEACAIRRAFPGLKGGEQEVTVLLCTVHTIRTRLRNLGSNRNVLSKMIEALGSYCLIVGKRTKVGCLLSVQEAIRYASEKMKQYISRNYEGSSDQWALWRRSSSCMLMQDTSTNALESYHRCIKQKLKRNYTLEGLGSVLSKIHSKQEEKMKDLAQKTRMKQYKEAKLFPALHKFPAAIQDLLVKQISKAQKNMQKGKAPRKLSSWGCDCDFFQRYILPCKHIVQSALQGDSDIVSDAKWADLIEIFGESGFEAYTKMEKVWIAEVNADSGNYNELEPLMGRIFAFCEQVKAIYYNVKESEISLLQKKALLEKLANTCESIIGKK